MQAEPIKITREQSGQQVFKKIVEYLDGHKIQYEVLEHSNTRTSKESAEERNTPLQWGSKTMLVKGIQRTYLLLYRADKRISWKKMRKIAQLGKGSRMCVAEQVEKLGILPGAVPPFAKLLGVDGIVDSKFRQVKMMAFNAGLQGKSIVMKTENFPFEQIKEADLTQ